MCVGCPCNLELIKRKVAIQQLENNRLLERCKKQVRYDRLRERSSPIPSISKPSLRSISFGIRPLKFSTA
jgi:hypothetical protein